MDYDYNLVPEEQELADALRTIASRYGKFNDDNTGVWAGYTPASENEDNAKIGVKCGNCVFFNSPNGCEIIASDVEDGGLCRFAVLPDGAVTAAADPCWDGYKQVGMKEKDGKMVPNCVPIDASIAAAAGDGETCPPATKSIPLNIKNRQNAIDNVGYGPLNPAESNDKFWQDKATRWNTNIEEAKSARCGNCVFFIRTPSMLECIESGIGMEQEAEGTIAAGELGYCSALDFKCASERTCNAWAAGGPITATAGSKAAPKKDQIKGSDKNKKGSASDGKGVTFTEAITTSLEKKVKTHNEKAPNGRKVTLAKLKAVYRRGAGAFSTSHRPDQNRNSWAMARVNAFLHLVRSGKPKNAKYVTDNDLLPKMHPRHSTASTMTPLLASMLSTLNFEVPDAEYVEDSTEPWLF